MVKKLKKVKSKKAFKVKLKTATVYSIAEVIFFLLALLVVISFSRRGAALIWINDLLVLYFSWTAIFLPFFFLMLGFLVSKFKTPLAQPNVVVGFSLFFVSILSLTRAGIFGNHLWQGLEVLLTKIGAFLFFLATSIVGLIVLFNTPVEEVIGFVSQLIGILKQSLFGEKTKFRQTRFGDQIKIGGNVFKNSLPKENSGKEEPAEVLTAKLVSNIPGEEKIWKYPPLDILGEASVGKADRGSVEENAATIERTLDDFGVWAKVVEVNYGPAVTQYAIHVASGTKLSKITALERDLALALAAPTGTIRIEAPIPGRSLVGLELPNKMPEFVSLKKMLDSDEMKNNPSKLAVALGLDVAGKAVVADLSKMPHVLIAGQTGSGKSVCINAFLSSLLFRASPAEVKLVLVDPKRVEMTHYAHIPHLLTPVVTDLKEVVSVLGWVLEEMERRYKIFAEAGTRNIDRYNETLGFQALPYIVLVVDELAEVMFFSPVEVEAKIARIAQLSRATGIHMVLATQRPSVDVITGLIKANIPCRIAFAVASQVDSRVILDSPGAEKLLGRGDMLYLPPEQAKPIRIQGAFVSDKEIDVLTSFLKNQGVSPQYVEEATKMTESTGFSLGGGTDKLFPDAVRMVCQYDKASTSMLQRRLSIGYSRAARLVDQLEAAGVIGPAQEGSSKARDVLIKDPEDFLASFREQG